MMQTDFLIAMPGGSEWILIIIAVLVLFGGRKIPEFMKGRFTLAFGETITIRASARSEAQHGHCHD